MNKNFSYAVFELAGKDTAKAREIADELQQAVNERLHEIILKEINLIVGELNQKGHNLRLQDEPKAGDINYIENDGLRLSVDAVISCGFSHLCKAEKDS